MGIVKIKLNLIEKSIPSLKNNTFAPRLAPMLSFAKSAEIKKESKQ
jgi:hypothetical protein